MKPKIIISHDVDHLYGSDHWGRDLIYPKLWVRSFLQFTKREITWGTLKGRVASCFEKRRHRIPEVMEFDRQHGVPSVFFFGMNQGLGLSYYPQECRDVIFAVKDAGFDVGVHGISYNDLSAMRLEHDAFASCVGCPDFGIRMHYVRKDERTLLRLSEIGYLFDSTEFDKSQSLFAPPSLVGNMWEFPLHIMDGYTVVEGQRDLTMSRTLSAINAACAAQVPYITILFHDYLFNNAAYPDEKAWYVWLIQYLSEEGFEFTSYRDAIREMDQRRLSND